MTTETIKIYIAHSECGWCAIINSRGKEERIRGKYSPDPQRDSNTFDVSMETLVHAVTEVLTKLQNNSYAVVYTNNYHLVRVGEGFSHGMLAYNTNLVDHLRIQEERININYMIIDNKDNEYYLINQAMQCARKADREIRSDYDRYLDESDRIIKDIEKKYGR